MKWDRLTSAIVAILGTIATHFLGGADEILILLIKLMIIDYALGLICGYKEKALSSKVGFKGILKKIAVLCVVAVGVVVDNTINGQGAIRSMVIYFYSGMEGISILENVGRMGVPIPAKLKESLIQLREGNEKEVKEQ